NKELNATHSSDIKAVDSVIVCTDLEFAKTTAKRHVGESVFCIFYKTEGHCAFFWVDPRGTDYPLEPSKELKGLFLKQRSLDATQDCSKLEQKIKKEMHRIKETFLLKTQVLVNPLDDKTSNEVSNETLIAQGAHSTFVLRGKMNEYRLWWLNSMGVQKEISLQSYPQLSQWLNKQEAFADAQLSQLRTHLIGVNTSNSLGSEQLLVQTDLNNLFLRKPGTKPSQTPQTQPKHLNLSLFAEVESCLGKRKDVEHREVEEIEMKEFKKTPGRLDLDAYPLVSGLFNHRAKPVDAEVLTLKGATLV
ncbi:MAG: hypothetical protein ACHP6H_04870, partial [Legionellales bacterium]